jgi:hypothetical protein
MWCVANDELLCPFSSLPAKISLSILRNPFLPTAKGDAFVPRPLVLMTAYIANSKSANHLINVSQNDHTF